jgi:hypothetical protein
MAKKVITLTKEHIIEMCKYSSGTYTWSIYPSVETIFQSLWFNYAKHQMQPRGISLVEQQLITSYEYPCPFPVSCVVPVAQF